MGLFSSKTSGEVVPFEQPEKLESLTLEELFKEAEQYGKVMISTLGRPGQYYSVINFECEPGVELKAESDTRLEVHDALIQAIRKAEKITKAFKD